MKNGSGLSLLDNPIWNSLTTQHAGFAVGGVLARRYRSEIGPLTGLREPSGEALAELAAIAPLGDISVLFLEERIAFPAGWQILREGALVQMLCPSPPAVVEASEEMIVLGPEDNAEMVALATLTEPGPFRDGTATLGGFVGVRVGGRLAAMAGQRLSPAGSREVSAVCTHPEFRGRGFARALVARVSRDIFAAGEVPFLSAMATNVGAIRVYEQVGFHLRRELELAVVRPALGR